MKSFLQRVSEDVVRRYGNDLSSVVVVCSNKRASLFMNQCLADIVGQPMFSPQYVSMSELFHAQSDSMVVDDIRAIHTLYNVYQQIVPSEETIDAFWGWGEILLNDFNDIDKHLGDVDAIFCNVRDLHAYDSVAYLSDDDKRLLQSFFAEFSADHDTRLKERFLHLWNRLRDIYYAFNAALAAQHLTYEGALYRAVALRADDIDWGDKRYLFVGFNMLSAAEQRLFSALHKKGVAQFYWDYDRYYLSDSTQEAGTYLRQWLPRYPNALPDSDDALYDNFSRDKDITFLSASSEDIQAQYVDRWLHEGQRMAEGQRTAIVLADARLLKSVVRHLPEEVSSKVNIVMGVPLSDTLATTFVDNFLRLHIYNYNAREGVYVSRQARALLHHPYTSLLLGDDTAEATLLDNRAYVVAADALCTSDTLSLLFSPVVLSAADANKTLVARLRTLLSNIGCALEQERGRTCQEKGLDPLTAASTYDEQMRQEAVYRMYTLLTPLYDILTEATLTIVPTTLLRLIDQMVARTTMPFHGEPVAGLQITGVIETRNLDFDHVLLLSCNEGTLPRGARGASFIPYVVRKAHGLSTPEGRMAVEAYSFYHLVQRCGDLSFAFNSSTDDGKTGQMSRFMLQLMADEKSRCAVRHATLLAEQLPYSAVCEVRKTEAVQRVLRSLRSLSPSAIGTYLRCPLQFYYRYVAHMSEPESDTIDDGITFGNIFHLAMKNIYADLKDAAGSVEGSAIAALLAGEGRQTIVQYVEDAIREEVFHGGAIHYDGLLYITRDVIVHYVALLLSADSTRGHFVIEGLEREIYDDLVVVVDGEERHIEVGGIIDRLERVASDDGDGTAQVLRVVDYKTGGGEIKTIDDVDDIFDPKKIDAHSEYFLQAMFYAILVRHSQQPYTHRATTFPPLNKDNLAVRPAVVFVRRGDSRQNPLLRFGTPKDGTPIRDVVDYEEAFRDRLRALIADILSAAVPFTATSNTKRCEHCNFVRMCGGGCAAAPADE